MTDDRSARLNLPCLQVGQSQKETTHNEALALLDLAVQAGVIATEVDSPPSAPDQGACWIVGSSPVGEWAGHAAEIAGWTAGGWRFVEPREGMRVWSANDAVDVRFVDGAWRIGEVAATRISVGGLQVVGAQHPSVSPPVGGVVVDTEARATLASLLIALQEHGLLAS